MVKKRTRASTCACEVILKDGGQAAVPQCVAERRVSDKAQATTSPAFSLQ